MKTVYACILNYNSRNETIKCLASLRKINKSGFGLNVVLVDNNSDEKLGLNEDFISPIPLKIINNSENLGFTGGNNVGIKYALVNSADYILILNNDTTLDSFAISKMISSIKSNSKIGIVVPKIYFSKGREYHKDKYKKDELGKVFWYTGGQIDWNNIIGFHRGVDEVDSGQYDKAEETSYATGCCMLVKREVFEKVGLFDEKYFLYYEDGDFSQRVKKNGYNIFYEPKAIIYHENAGSTGGSGSNLQDYYISRNRMLFGLKYAPLRSKIALIKESLSLLKNGREWQKRGIRDFYRGKFGKGSFNP